MTGILLWTLGVLGLLVGLLLGARRWLDHEAERDERDQ